MSDDQRVNDWWAAMIKAHDDQRHALHDAYQQLENAGLISKVAVHRYLCRKCHRVLATVIRIGGTTIARTTDYKMAPGMNASRSVESARKKNTLDGDRHWPGHTFDVGELSTWGDTAGMDMNCRHGLRTVTARDILAAAEGVRPGHPGKPSLI